MKTKRVVHILALLIALGTVAFFLVAHSDERTAEDPWEAWIDEQTDTVLKSAGEMDAAQRAEMRATVRQKFSALAAELKNEIALPPRTQDYTILQTVKELRAAYDKGYDHKHKGTNVRVSYKVQDTEMFAYDENVSLAEVDAKYPRDAWLQMLLDEGVEIENAKAYWEYLFLRDTLVHLERQPQVWTSSFFDIPATEDWETYKTAYIERELGRIQERLEKDGHVRVFYDDELLKDLRFLEKDGGHREMLRALQDILERNGVHGKVFHSLQDFPKEVPWIAFKNNHLIVVPQSVKALRRAYDEKYNEKYAMTSGSVSYTHNGVTFKYNIPLPLSDVDAKYPRDEWLQMLLDKGISVDNFEEYWTYLSKRVELVALEAEPEVWSSGLFGVDPTDDWDTYKAAYLDQMLEKFDRGKQHAVYFGKADAEAAINRSRALIEKLERSQRGLRDR